MKHSNGPDKAVSEDSLMDEKIMHERRQRVELLARIEQAQLELNAVAVRRREGRT
jgi:hypothetical protein